MSDDTNKIRKVLYVPQMYQEECMIGTARAIIQWPSTMSPAECDDLIYWLEGVKKKARRSVQLETKDA